MQPISIGVDFGTSNTVIAMVGAGGRSAVMKVTTRVGEGSALPSILCFRPAEPNPRERPISSAEIGRAHV